MKGARLISNDYERVILYQKQGSLDEAVEDFYSLDPTEVLQVGFRLSSYEPRSEKTGHRGFRPGPTQTGLYSHRRWLEA